MPKVQIYIRDRLLREIKRAALEDGYRSKHRGRIGWQRYINDILEEAMARRKMVRLGGGEAASAPATRAPRRP